MNLPDFGSLGIIGGILIAFALIGFFKGLIRTTLGLTCLAAACYAAFWVRQHAHEFTATWVEHPGPWLFWSLAFLAGLAVLMLSRYLMGFLIDPFDASRAGQRIGFGFPAALFSLIIGFLLLWLALAGVRYGGSLAELQDTQLRLQDAGNSAPEQSRIRRYATPVLLKARRALDAGTVGKWHRVTDPFDQPEKIKLSRILILYHHVPTRQIMLTMPEFNSLLNSPAFLALAHDAQIKQTAVSDYPVELFNAEPVAEAITNRELLALLEKTDPEQLLNPPKMEQ
jgi:hypothetical protein